MSRLDQVVMEWDADRTLILTVEVVARGRASSAIEHRLAEMIAAHLWLALREEDARPAAAE